MRATALTLTRRRLLAAVSATPIALAASRASPAESWAVSPWRRLSDADWRARLPGESYAVLRREATERPFSSPLNNEHRPGVFACRGCGLPLFRSQWKFESGTGWPSFYQVLAGAVGTKPDLAIGVLRTEYHCARCLGHQGHVFNDGPAPTELRYCNNGVALTFAPA